MKLFIFVSFFLTSCFPIEEYANELIHGSSQSAYLREHRKYIKYVEYDQELELHARAWANVLADRCKDADYSLGNPYLENVYQSWGVRKLEPSAILKKWSIDNRIVALGCGDVMCVDEYSRAVSWYYVCNYKLRDNRGLF